MKEIEEDGNININNNINNNNNINSINSNSIKPQVKRKGKDLKIIIVGDSGTGKTSFVNKYISNKFAETYSPTIVSQFSYKIIKIDDIIYRLQFWDVAGQDRSPQITGVFCKDTKGIILCCEVKNKSSQENTIKWKESVEKTIDIKNIPIILVENKCDLLGKEEKDYNKDIDSLNRFSEENNLKKSFRTSALNGYGIENAMNFLIREILGSPQQTSNEDERRDSIVLRKENHLSIRNRKKKCC